MALSDSAVSRIVLVAGTYEFDDDMCPDVGGSALCIGHNVTIEAEVAGSVVLDAKGARRVIYVSTTAGRTELVGLNITGGDADYGGGILIGGSASLTDCNVYDSVASIDGGGLHILGAATLTNTNVYANQADRDGGGLFIAGTATLINTNVHENQADRSGGGLIIAGTATLTNTNVYANQAASYGCDIFSERLGFLTLRNFSVASSESSCPSGSMLDLGVNSYIHCPLGLWVPPSPLTLPPMNFTGCPYTCAAGHFGNTTIQTDYKCSGKCDGGGEFCPDASIQPLLCPAGTYLPVGVAGLVEASCIPCAPGAYNPDEGGTRCLTCPAGKLSENISSTECSDCPRGGSCSAEGAASLRQTFTPCPTGTFNPDGGQNSSASCQACAPGKASTITGSSDPADCRSCSAGFVAAASGAAFCDECAAGKYQAGEGEQACVACEPGSYCPEGASALLSCEEGTYSSSTSLTSASACTETGVGHFAPTGSTKQTPCSPGTVASTNALGICVPCAAGSFMNVSGQSVCLECPAGFVCAAQATAAVPCPGGTFGGSGGLRGVSDCEDAPPGFYAQAGSIAPTTCPSWGFCPGRQADQVNGVPGSIPIVIPEGQQTTTVIKVVEQAINQTVLELPLQVEVADVNAFNDTAVRLRVADMLGLPLHAVSLNFRASRRRLDLLTAHSRRLDALDFIVTITDEPAVNITSAESVWKSKNLSTLSVELRLDVIDARSPVVATEVTVQYVTVSTLVVAECPAGSWGANGECVPCSKGTYRPGDSKGTGCLECPASTYQPFRGGSECMVCGAGNYSASTLSCEPCQKGTYSSGDAAVECLECPSGEYQPETGRISCETCGAGNYSSNVLSCEPCPVGRYCPEGSVVGESCPIGFTTEGNGAVNYDDCGCPEGMLNSTAAPEDNIICTTCSDDMNCTRTGLTLATVPLPPFRWRLSNRTADIETCDTSGDISPCLGGVDGTKCTAGHEGPRCEVCSHPDRYYDAASATCNGCGNVERYALKQLAVLLVIVAIFALLRIALLRMPRLLARVSSKLAQLATSVQHLGLQAKFKLVLSFAQVWLVRESVYGFTLPSGLSDWLSVLEPLGFDLGSFIFPDWKCVGGLTTRLAFNGLWPLVLMLVVALGLTVREATRKGPLRSAALRTLEAAVFISFCVLPSVTRSLFLAFQCRSFGFDDLTSETKSYLTVSLDIECTGSGAHQPIIALAGGFIVLWPLAMPLLYALLLYRCRRSIQNHQPSPLSRAIRFLWSDYEDGYYWYEMIALAKKLVLTNFVLFINFGRNDQLLRLLIGQLTALLDLTLQQQTQPFRKQSDDALSCVVQLMLVLFFALGIVLKLCDTDGLCSSVVGMDSAYTASVFVICVGLIGVLVPIGMVSHQLFFARPVPILRDARTMEPPKLLLGEGDRYHLFLSHIWSTGQDQCAIIKRQLQLLLPGVIVFLDVDDLEDVGDLEGYVRATSVMLFFLSKKYFGSRNCLKEIVASIEQGKPLVLVHEQQEDKGGGPLEILKAECRDDQMREAIFDGRTPIAWHRIYHFQNLTLKLIATEMLRNGPRFQGSLSERPSAGNAPEDLVLIQHGEVNAFKLTLPQLLVLWCSAGNPGAAEVAEELVTSMASNGAAIRVVDTMPDVQALKENGKSVAMLLYLNKDTWVEQGEVLERDVRAARKVQAGLKVVMVHENDKDKGGCEFGDFFGTTPQELIDDGIYSAIAIALHTPPHRAVSLALVAQALGATQGKGRRLSRMTKSLSFRLSKSFRLSNSRKKATTAKPTTAVEVQVSSTQDGV